MTMNESTLDGPLESGATFPSVLTARVVTPGAEPRVHGYDVEGDLALHYQYSDLLFLSLTGELPDPAVSRAFGVALLFLAPVSVAHASTHAAVVGRLCGAPAASTFGVAAIGVAEHARFFVDEHAALLQWLRAPHGPLPERYRAIDPANASAVRRLKDALAPSGLDVTGLEAQPSREAALVMLLFACGFRRRERLEAAIALARLPSAVAEALAERPANFGNYPINLPRFLYSESR
jgi:hypothetical protein